MLSLPPHPYPSPAPRIAYCAPYLGGMGQDRCGQLLRVTNNSGGRQVIVRIVDMCGNGGGLTLVGQRGGLWGGSSQS
jgi:hypothetical protein